MGTLQPVTVIGQKKTLLNTAVGVSTIISKKAHQAIGGRYVTQALKNGSLWNRTLSALQSFGKGTWNFIKGVGPLIGRGASVIGGVLIPTPTGEGASFTPEQMYERIYPNPEYASDDYLAEAEKRMNAGNALPNDWRLVEEIQRRKTARENGGGGGGSEKPAKYTNPGHHDPNGGPNPYDPEKSVLPKNHEELWKESVQDPNSARVRWTKEGKGRKAVYHRFEGDKNGDWHWNGSTNGRTKNNVERKISLDHVPKEIKRS
jgi:hypothetical protein